MTVFDLKNRLKSLLILIISSNSLDYLICDTNRLQIDQNKLNDCSDIVKKLYMDSGHSDVYQIYLKLLNKDLSSDASGLLTKYDANLCNIFFEKYKNLLHVK